MSKPQAPDATRPTLSIEEMDGLTASAFAQAKQQLAELKAKELEKFKTELVRALTRLEVHPERGSTVIELDPTHIDVMPVLADLATRGYYISTRTSPFTGLLSMTVSKTAPSIEPAESIWSCTVQ